MISYIFSLLFVAALVYYIVSLIKFVCQITNREVYGDSQTTKRIRKFLFKLPDDENDSDDLI